MRSVDSLNAHRKPYIRLCTVWEDIQGCVLILCRDPVVSHLHFSSYSVGLTIGYLEGNNSISVCIWKTIFLTASFVRSCWFLHIRSRISLLFLSAFWGRWFFSLSTQIQGEIVCSEWTLCKVHYCTHTFACMNAYVTVHWDANPGK